MRKQKPTNHCPVIQPGGSQKILLDLSHLGSGPSLLRRGRKHERVIHREAKNSFKHRCCHINQKYDPLVCRALPSDEVRSVLLERGGR